MPLHTFYDTETTGPQPRFDQVLQAAAILTDDDFVEQDWLDERSRLAGHIVPTAGALKVTHVDPYDIARAKHSAHGFARMLHDTFTSWAGRGDEISYNGYNTIRFDEEIMRQMFWENLLDPYITSGKGTYRNDLLTVVRAVYARNPDCIEVPKREDGRNNFKLENLAPLNGFSGHDAHDALGDVRATIHIARMIRDIDPALWEHMQAMGNARSATDFVDGTVVFRMLGGPMLDPGILDCCLVASEAANPKNKSAWNLAVDPVPYLDMAPQQILAAMQKTGTPFRSVKCNRQPAAFPMGWEFLNRVSNERFEPADPMTIDERAEMIRTHDAFRANTAEALRLRTEGYAAPDTLEEKIYSGFPGWDDKNRMKRLHATPDWSKRLEIVRCLEKPEIRALGIRMVYLNAPEALSGTLRKQCAMKIDEERHTLRTDRPWTTPGTLMAELDRLQALEPDCPELANIRAWALETYPAAREWTGAAPETPKPEATEETNAHGSSAAPGDAGATPGPGPQGTPSGPGTDEPGAAGMHFLDGLD